MTRTITLFLLAAVPVFGFAASEPAPGSASGGGASELRETGEEGISPEWGELPEEVVRVLEAKSEAYKARALGFTCTEVIRETDYDDGSADEERRRSYDYLLIRDEDAPFGLRALRTKPGSSGEKEREVELPFPEAYFWSQVFSRPIRSILRYKVGEWHTTPWKLAMPISWMSAAPVLDGDHITEWSGTAEVEYRTGNILSVVAEPNLQDRKMVAQLRKYLQAFRFMGISTAPPPEGFELRVQFGYEHENFTYPTRVELHRFRQVDRKSRVTVERQVIEYKDYRFFGTNVKDDFPPFLYRPQPDRPLPEPDVNPEDLDLDEIF